MHSFKDSVGYLLGLCIFVLGIPAVMWWVSGRPCPYVPESTLRCFLAVLLGIYLYDLGWLIYLGSWWPLAVFLVQAILLTLQVRSEEKRLAKDFGEAYQNYKKRTGRYLPFPICRK